MYNFRYNHYPFFLFIIGVCTAMIGSNAWSACGDDYNLNHHSDSGKLDICSIEHELPAVMKIQTNWGTKPEWVDNDHFVFVSNQIGDIYLMDLSSNEVSLLTGHFAHAGFTRVHVLKNKDLLLIGPSRGPQPPADPLVIYDKGQFIGDMFVLKAPYDGLPIPLGMHAWEGVAVSTESNRIVWSDVNLPFFGKHWLISAIYYIFGRSNLWTGVIEYDTSGKPSLQKIEHIIGKKGFTFFEPQSLKGNQDQELLFNAYGPTSKGSGDSFIYNFNTRKTKEVPEGFNTYAYNEWEGIYPDYTKAFYEIDPDATAISGPSRVDLFIYDFESKESQAFAEFNGNDNFYLHEPVFSEDGKSVLVATGSDSGNEIRSPGYGIGVILIDYEAWSKNPVLLQSKRAITAAK